MVSGEAKLGRIKMNEEAKKKYTGVEIAAWMTLTALVTFCVMSYQYTKMTLKNSNENYNDYYYTYSGDNEFSKLKRVLGVIENEYLYEYDTKQLEEGAIRGMLESLEEPYTSYFDKDETEEFLTETEGEYEGIGVYIAIDTDKSLGIVLTPIKGSPAEKADVHAGDYILEINGESVREATLEEMSTRIKGKVGTKVKIKFARYNEETGKYDEIEKEIERAEVDINYFEYKVLEDNIGYIKFESFDEKAEARFKAAYKELVEKNKVSGLIIDVRNNPGGLITAATGITDKIVPTGIITYTLDKKNSKEVIYSDSTCAEVPVVVMINNNSASASEIMAAAIKDSGIGEIVGTTSYGKGLVQKFKSLGDGTYIKITISEYFSPNGNKINKIGVVPNYEVEDDENTEEDEQLKKAIEVIKTKK